MPIIKSAKKRVRVAEKATIRNVKTKRSMKTALKAFSKKSSTDTLKDAQSAIDKAAKKNVIHKNKAARLKSRAAKQAKAAGVKVTKTTKTAKPAAAKATKAPATKAKAKTTKKK